MTFASVPTSWIDAVPFPVTATPPPAIAVNVPLLPGTESVTVRFEPPISASATEMPVSLVGVSSVIASGVVNVFTGASFTGVTVMLNG